MEDGGFRYVHATLVGMTFTVMAIVPQPIPCFYLLLWHLTPENGLNPATLFITQEYDVVAFGVDKPFSGVRSKQPTFLEMTYICIRKFMP